MKSQHVKNIDFLAISGGKPAISIPRPHFNWRTATESQKLALKEYIDNSGPLSIYGGDGVYELLEQDIQQIYDCKYCLLTNSGTSSLNSAYVGIGLNPRDEVIVPTYTFLATVTPLLRIGAKIVFADACSDTGNIDPVDIERKITGNTKAVVLTHMWGNPCNMETICDLTSRYRLKLIEDCSHAHLTKYDNKLCGTFGDVACFSIGAQKTWTCGEGGFLITNDPEVYLRSTLLGHFEKRVEHSLRRILSEGGDEIAKKYSLLKSGYGENYRMHPLAAVMARAFLKNDLGSVLNHRKESLSYLTYKLDQIIGVSPPVLHPGYFSGAMFGYKPHFDLGDIDGNVSLERLISALQHENVEARTLTFGTLHDNPIFASKNHLFSSYDSELNHQALDSFPGAAKYLNARFSLPTFSGGLEQDREIIDQYSTAIAKVVANSRSLI